MGITLEQLNEIRAFGLLHPGSSILDIGSSNLYSASPDAIRGFLAHYNVQADHDFVDRLSKGSGYGPGCTANESFVGELLEHIGLKYLSIDVANGYRTKVLDLNIDSLPSQFLKSFDTVINFGTTEHIINQINVFKLIHDSMRVGGHVVHRVPTSGRIDHGYFKYTPRFFFDLAGYNEYELVDFAYAGPAPGKEILGVVRDYQSYFPALSGCLSRQSRLANESVVDFGLQVILRKVTDAPFRLPMERSTSVVRHPSSENQDSQPSLIDPAVLGATHSVEGQAASVTEQNRTATDNGLGILAADTDRLRNRLTWDPNQLKDIHALYARYVEFGQPFPSDLEEHSLRLILKFVRSDDENAARRLQTILEGQGKPVPFDVRALADQGILRSPERMASDRRARPIVPGDSTADTSLPPLHNRLVFVTGLPKSASRLMVSVLAAMHPDPRYRKGAVLPYSTGYVGIDATTDLRFESLAQFNDGGIVHTHASVTTATRHALARLGLSQVITVRHPADHLAALYCHIRRIAKTLPASLDLTKRIDAKKVHLPDPLAGMETYGRDNEGSELFFHPVIFPVDRRYFLPWVEVDDAIAHMIAGGYLYHALSWIVAWQLLRVRNISVIVRYEDFIGDPDDTLRRVNVAVFGGDSEQNVSRGREALKKGAYEDKPDPAIYPRGSTGAYGIWKEYLSPANRHLYNSVCERFVMAHPYGAMIKNLYEDLLLDT